MWSEGAPVRPVLSLALIPFVLLTQVAAGGHTHAGDQPVGHDGRSHVHLPFASHCHRPNGHDGDHRSGASEAPPPDSDHDADAVYVGGIDLAVGGRSGGESQQVAPAPWPFDPSAQDLTALGAARQGRSSRPHHPPPTAASRCALYVRHLALLI